MSLVLFTIAMSNHHPEPARRCPEQVEPDRGHHTDAAFYDAYLAARADFIGGVRDVIFPAGTCWLRRFASAVCQPLAAPPERRQDGSCEEDRWGRGLPAVARDYLAPWMAHLLVVVRSIFGTAEPWFGAARSGSRGLSLPGDDQRR